MKKVFSLIILPLLALTVISSSASALILTTTVHVYSTDVAYCYSTVYEEARARCNFFGYDITDPQGFEYMLSNYDEIDCDLTYECR